MKIIFLDIDGVLNHQLWYGSKEHKEKKEDNLDDYHYNQIDPSRVELLNSLTDGTGAKIVVSSSWRKNWKNDEDMITFFESVGITGEIIGRTPMLFFAPEAGFEYGYSVPRGCEIKAWLEVNKDILGKKISKVNYVIFDDDSDMLWWQRSHYVQVDNYCGLTPSVIHKAKYILSREYD